MHVAKLLPLVLSVCFGFSLSTANYADEPATQNEYGLAVGKKMPFHVADFLTGEYRAGCPSVMISNAKSRGVIIWTRATDGSDIRLAKALDAKAIDGTKLLGFFVAFHRSKEELQENLKGIEHLVVGVTRGMAHASFEAPGIDEKAQTVVFFLDRKDIKSMRSFSADELNDTKIEELIEEARTFVPQDK